MRLKDYLSWSQLITLETSEAQYIRKYIHGEDFTPNRGMILGKEIADSLESGEETGDIAKDFIVASLPKFECMDHDYKTTIEVKGVHIPLFSKIDSAKKDLSAFYEYKTGVTPWSQRAVDSHGQIDFYCVVAHAIKGRIPQEIKLFHAVVEDGQFTGEIREYKTSRTITDILKMKIRIHKAWTRIAELVKQELL